MVTAACGISQNDRMRPCRFRLVKAYEVSQQQGQKSDSVGVGFTEGPLHFCNSRKIWKLHETLRGGGFWTGPLQCWPVSCRSFWQEELRRVCVTNGTKENRGNASLLGVVLAFNCREKERGSFTSLTGMYCSLETQKQIYIKWNEDEGKEKKRKGIIFDTVHKEIKVKISVRIFVLLVNFPSSHHSLVVAERWEWSYCVHLSLAP